MSIKGINLAWIVVKDIKKAIQFYTQTVGLKLVNFDEQFGWAELSGPSGAVLGIAQKNDYDKTIQPGQNAVITMSVENLEQAKSELSRKGAEMQGEVMEVPGHVKLQMVKDQDGNHFQLVQNL